MGLHKEPDEQSFTDVNFDEQRDADEDIEVNVDDLSHKKQVRKLLEEKLERKRLKEEFMDDFDEIGGEFDWEDLDK